MNPLIEKIEDINHDIESLKKQRDLIIDEYIAEVCPHKIGDTITVNGYAHTGKSMKITWLSLKQGYNNEYFIRAGGTVLRNNGTESMNTAEWFSNR